MMAIIIMIMICNTITMCRQGVLGCDRERFNNKKNKKIRIINRESKWEQRTVSDGV